MADGIQFRWQWMMHFGKLNQSRTSIWMNRALGSTTAEQDLGVQVHSFLKELTQVDTMKKVCLPSLTKALSLRVGTLSYKCTNLWFGHTSSTVCSCQSCNKMDVFKLERVQKDSEECCPDWMVWVSWLDLQESDINRLVTDFFLCLGEAETTGHRFNRDV